MKEVTKLVTKSGEPVFVVLSAMSGTTNSLVEISNYLYKKNPEGANEVINQLERKYLKHIDELYSTDAVKAQIREFLTSEMNYLRSFTKELFTSFEEKSIVAQGELISTNMVVAYMQELGMLVDVSHLSDGGFRDVAEICTKPFVATHSNARAVGPHQRNLTDEQIRILADKGGVMGMNFYPMFLNPDMNRDEASAAMIARHVRHIADVGGVDVVGIGTDFDGFEGKNEIMSSDRMPLLADALKAEGFTEEEIAKIYFRNVLRVMKDAVR